MSKLFTEFLLNELILGHVKAGWAGRGKHSSPLLFEILYFVLKVHKIDIYKTHPDLARWVGMR